MWVNSYLWIWILKRPNCETKRVLGNAVRRKHFSACDHALEVVSLRPHEWCADDDDDDDDNNDIS